MLSGTYLLIEATGFTQAVSTYFRDDESYSSFQAELAAQPDRGQVIPGAPPLRKLRWVDGRRGKGKRSGLRVIYIHFPDLQILFRVDVYGKDEAEDLSRDEKVFLKALAAELGEELRSRKMRGQL